MLGGGTDASGHACENETKTMRRTRFVMVTVAVSAVLAALVRQSFPYPSYLPKARKYGARDCSFCHADAAGGNSWNARGRWLIREKERRRADDIDADWLADYKPESSDNEVAPKKTFPDTPDRSTSVKADDVDDVHAQWLALQQSPDRERLSRMIADDFLATTSEGMTLDREQTLTRILQTKLESLRAEDVVVRYFGSAAVITSRWVVTPAENSARRTAYRSTEVWVKRQQQWQIVSLHLTEMR